MESSEGTSLPDRHFIILTVILMLEPELSYFSTMSLFPLFLLKRTIKRGETVNMTEIHKCTRHTHLFPCTSVWCYKKKGESVSDIAMIFNLILFF